MPRYIDAEILEHKFIEWRADLKKKKETAKTQREAKRTSDIAAGVVCCLMELRDAPTADVQEVKPGHWIDKGVLENYPRPGINVYHLLCCSECGALHRVRPYCEGGWINASYCPNCSAKMGGGKVINDNE